jgi:hypothetical protein
VELISIVSSIASVVALALAVWQTRLAQSQSKLAQTQMDHLRKINEGVDGHATVLTSLAEKLGTTSDNLSMISKRMSTQFKRGFPEYLPEVRDLIRRAERELLILGTSPISGAFSDPDSWRETKRAIDDSNAVGRRPVEMHCIFGDEAARRDMLSRQFALGNGLDNDVDAAENRWRQWRDSDEIRPKMERFSHRFGDGQPASDIDRETFIQLFENAATEALKTAFVGPTVCVKVIPIRSALYFWIADQREAVFAIESYFPSYSSQAFLTSDPDMISALVKLHADMDGVAQTLKPFGTSGRG